jgi:HD-GYP domain-containing protein (c-di-GMP phosphodiesterase class II)
VLGAAGAPDVWEATLDAEPTPWARIPDADLDAALGAVADFADLKSPWHRGHSPGVAALAAGAAAFAGCHPDQIRDVRRAGLLHDLGRVGVPNGVWDTPGPLTAQGREKVRLHPYLTERILSRPRRLASLARLASCHHERADASGYHRGARGSELSVAERLLGAADAYHAMTEDRPHRGALTAAQACAALRADAASDLFEVADVEAVVEAAGHEPRRQHPANPAGLTEREIEVLRLIARGRSNRQVASALVISAKTVGSHVEHIYAKAGVSTRAGAALFAMEHGLLDAG